MHGVLAVFLIMALCIVTANEEPQAQETYLKIDHSDEPNLNVSRETKSIQESASIDNVANEPNYLKAGINTNMNLEQSNPSSSQSIVKDDNGMEKSTQKVDVSETSARVEMASEPTEKSRSYITDLKRGDIIIEGDSIRRSPLGKISHTFYAKVNTGLFVDSGKNKTAIPSMKQPSENRSLDDSKETSTDPEGTEDPPKETGTDPEGTEDNQTVLAKDVNQKDAVENAKEQKEKDNVKVKAKDPFERSELYNREPVPVDFQHHHRDSSGCEHQSCEFSVNGRDSDDTYSEENDDYDHKASVRMLMAPTDEYFYMSSDTLQDLWRNHINADSSLPLDIIETSASELIDYYELPPDPNFIVPVMTSPQVKNYPINQHTETPEVIPHPPVFETAQNKEGLPDESHYTINFPYQQVVPTAAPEVFDQVLPRPPPYYNAPTFIQGLYPVPIYTTPPYTQMTGSSSNGIRNIIQQPPEYRNIPSGSVSGFPFNQPIAINQTLLSMGINNILENVPPSFVIHSPTDMPTMQIINAVTGMMPGIMLEHGIEPYFPEIYDRGSHVGFPGKNIAVRHQPEIPFNSGGVMVTPQWEREDPHFHTVKDKTGDTHVIIRIKSPSTTTTKQPVQVMNVPDINGYSEITLEDGKKILIRVEGEKNEVTSVLPPVTQPSTPVHETSTQNHIRNNPKQNIRTRMPRIPTKPRRKTPFHSRPADERFSSTGTGNEEDTDRTFLNANIGNLLNKGNVGGALNNGFQGGGYGTVNTGSMYDTGYGTVNTGSMYNTGYGGTASGTGSQANAYGMGNAGNPQGTQNYGSSYGSGGQGTIFNKGSLGNFGGQFNNGGLGNIFNGLKANNPFSKGNLGNIFDNFNKGNPFGGGGISSLTEKFNTGNLFNKGNINNIKNEITNSVGQVQNKFQQLVGPLQTQVDSSFESAVGFLQMFFSHVIPGDYYENVLTILAILAFIAFVGVRLSLMFSSLSSSVTLGLGLFGRAEEVLNSLRESDQVQVLQDLASDVYKSIELWAQENLELPSAGISNLFFNDKITKLFGLGKDSKGTLYDNTNGGNLVKKTLFAPDSDSQPEEPTKHNITGEIVEEMESVARLGSTLVDLTWRIGGRHSPVTKTSCLHRPFCDLNTISDQERGFSSLLIPIASTCVSWLARPTEDAFSLLETFRPLWLSNTVSQGEGCRRIHPCERLT